MQAAAKSKPGLDSLACTSLHQPSVYQTTARAVAQAGSVDDH
eukprot:CAMPEP_0202888960 /NCGR_PEP_ID=MMETSP1391-20130828/43458_1 /ASSEMBLY_ACC=CAM_ASM_000867 /TAXON_ID=1034604 /ORGANISM="Chlamydomonas leiostraca, Strain SAG 11-49" /LENGTH=41 /DNA_ID= /DNA_START= /DNA_END= /DNA_ORIENTATION=